MEAYMLGGLLVQFDTAGYPFKPGIFMERFRYTGPWKGQTLLLQAHIEPLALYTAYPKLGSGEFHDIYDVNGEPLIVYHWAYLKNAYAVWAERDRGHVCSFDPEIFNQPPMDADWFFGISGLQKALLHQNRPILHASYVGWQNQAILFAAPSQTGKSTQASLWQQYAGADIINGDRVLLGKDQGRWYAYGYPNCGSSNICKNIHLPIRAIVILRQGQDNVIQPLTQGQISRNLVAGFALHRWQDKDIDLAFSLAQDIACQVPVLEFCCRPDSDAVAKLRQYLEDTDCGKIQ
ncbi:MAG: hypothetical protein IJN53_01145 [Oscillospiraceae bacterium]|nr:hypothetical protein [Oscillospiraceae bacterium]